MALHDLLFRHPIITVPLARKELGVTYPTARDAIGKLLDLGILSEEATGRHPRSFTYTQYLEILTEGTSTGEDPTDA